MRSLCLHTKRIRHLFITHLRLPVFNPYCKATVNVLLGLCYEVTKKSARNSLFKFIIQYFATVVCRSCIVPLRVASANSPSLLGMGCNLLPKSTVKH